jgi:hypothetical protein
VHFTGSPRAGRLLSRRNGLPFVRVQPVHLQATVADTWKPVLARLTRTENLLVGQGSTDSPAALHA